MANFAFPDLKIELDDSGGTPQDISAFVTTINGWSKERIVEETTGAGDTTDKWKGIGFEQKGELELAGPYDDTALGMLAITKGWNDDSERTIKLTFDDPTAADVEIVECLLKRTQRNPVRGVFHQWIVTLQPTGAIT